MTSLEEKFRDESGLGGGFMADSGDGDEDDNC
jgi:hypothetical protein